MHSIVEAEIAESADTKETASPVLPDEKEQNNLPDTHIADDVKEKSSDATWSVSDKNEGSSLDENTLITPDTDEIKDKPSEIVEGSKDTQAAPLNTPDAVPQIPVGGSDIDVLLSALEEQQKRIVTTKRNDSVFQKKLDAILNPSFNETHDISPDVVQQMKDLGQMSPSTISESFIEENHGNRENLIYLSELNSYLNRLDVARDSYKNTSATKDSQTSTLEGISSLISDLSNAGAKRREDDDVISSDSISKLPQLDKDAKEEFSLTPEHEDDATAMLHAAQKAALAQIEANKEKEELLKQEAYERNARLSADDVNKVIADSEKTVSDKEVEHPYDESSDLVDKSILEENHETLQHDSDDKRQITSDEISKAPVSLEEALNDALKAPSAFTDKIDESKNTLSSYLQKAVADSLNGITGNYIGEVKSQDITPVSSIPLQSSDKEDTIATADNYEEVPDTSDAYEQSAPQDLTDGEDQGSLDREISDSSIAVSRSSALDIPENTRITDGNPLGLKEETIKLLESESQFENRRLGRQLKIEDFYDAVAAEDPWLQTIRKANYKGGPVYSALCYSNRIVNPDDKDDWTLEVSSDYDLLTSSPEFHHNIVTKFSFANGSKPVKITLKSVKGRPSGCPHDLAAKCYLRQIDIIRKRMMENQALSAFIEHLGDDVRTVAISIYTQDGLTPNEVITVNRS
ncbi:MAG: hypothetical protein ACI4NE_07955 [Succinivibrio sp.]